MVAIYARFKKVNEKIWKQSLIDHLIGTHEEIVKCLNRSYIKSALEALTKALKVDFNDIVEAMKVCAVFHDIGKAMHYYQKQINDVLSSKKDSITFQNHEAISSYILAKTFNSLSNFIFTNPRVQQLIIQAILLHHQGLRTLNIAELDTVRAIINDKSSSECNVKNLNQICDELIERSGGEHIVKMISENICTFSKNIIDDYYTPQIIIDYYSALPEDWVKISRAITGCLIIADIKDAHRAMGDEGTKFIKDIFKF